MAVTVSSSSLVFFCGVLSVFLLLVTNADAIMCYQCNAFFQGRSVTCDQPFNKTGCVACMKVVTKVKVRDSGYILGWERVSSVESRYCAFQANSPGLREEGCFYQQNNGGYTQRCFCYSNFCNKAGPSMHSASSWIYGVTSLVLIALASRTL